MTIAASLLNTARPAARRYISWLRDDLLPLWAERGWDGRHGGFYEALGPDGAPAPAAARRTRVQCRQIYVFLTAHAEGWSGGGEALGAAGFDHLLAHAFPDGTASGAVHSLTAEGAIADPTRDLYDHAFVLLCASTVWATLKDRRALALIDDTFAFLDRRLAHPVIGYRENDGGEGLRRQNPHMHLFEAVLAVEEAIGDGRALARADSLFDLFESHFLDPETGALLEYFDHAMEPAPGPKGRRIEPGHMMEWVCLLGDYGRLSSRSVLDRQQALFDIALRLGQAGNSPFLINARTLDAPPDDLRRRLWPQTEYLRACYVLGGGADAAADSAIDPLTEALFRTYLAHPTPGLWHDQLDGQDSPVPAATPASIPYHLTTLALAAKARL